MESEGCVVAGPHRRQKGGIMLGAGIVVTDSRGFMVRIGTLEIRNDGTGNYHSGHYNVTYTNEETLEVFTARVENYPRSYGPLILVKRAIEALENSGSVKSMSIEDIVNGKPDAA